MALTIQANVTVTWNGWCSLKSLLKAYHQALASGVFDRGRLNRALGLAMRRDTNHSGFTDKGFAMWTMPGKEVHHYVVTVTTCQCKDFTIDHKRCKHRIAAMLLHRANMLDRALFSKLKPNQGLAYADIDETEVPSQYALKLFDDTPQVVDVTGLLNPTTAVEDAIELAFALHKDVKDQTGAPLINHILDVIARCGTRLERVVAALHETIERKKLTVPEIENRFGVVVAEAVFVLAAQAGEKHYDHLQRVKKNQLARAVMIADLESTLDPDRLKKLTPTQRSSVQSRCEDALAKLRYA